MLNCLEWGDDDNIILIVVDMFFNLAESWFQCTYVKYVTDWWAIHTEH